jgi:hypothetical protein
MMVPILYEGTSLMTKSSPKASCLYTTVSVVSFPHVSLGGTTKIIVPPDHRTSVS